MRESELENKFREAVKKAGGIAFKFVSPGNAGVPDRIAVLPGGRIGFVELKANGNNPTKLQLMQMKRLKNLGCFVCVLDTPERIRDVISGIQLCSSVEDTAIVMKLLEAGEFHGV